ncbi:MAG: ATP synthase F1 subunit delta [Pseudomonadota bacterium]
MDLSASSTSSPGEAAHRYAAALFDMALDTGDVDGVEAGLSALAKTVAENDDLHEALRSPLYKSEDKQAVLAELTSKIALPDLAQRFIGVVAMNGRAGDIAGMAAAFAERAARHRGATRVAARTAKDLTAAQAETLTSIVSKALGRDVDVEFEVDPALIGGLQLRVGSRLVDASLRAKLDGLTNAMKGA